MSDPLLTARLHLRISEHDVHYAGGLVDGARLVALFGDAATELCIRHDGDEGLFRAYQGVEFLAPVHAGDFLEVTAELLSVGRTSRQMRFSVHRIIKPAADPENDSAADVLDTPELVARAEGTCVVPLEKQRRKKD
ncbi:MAG TPA: hotdog fold domain-containing protein [Anaerolineales bacterium]|nr:hotdog fold domain-containing protein [Anaerolineales bacterium]